MYGYVFEPDGRILSNVLQVLPPRLILKISMSTHNRKALPSHGSYSFRYNFLQNDVLMHFMALKYLMCFLFSMFVLHCSQICWQPMLMSTAWLDHSRHTCCGCLGTSCSTTHTATVWIGCFCPTHRRSPMQMRMPYPYIVGVQRFLHAHIVDSEGITAEW